MSQFDTARFGLYPPIRKGTAVGSKDYLPENEAPLEDRRGQRYERAPDNLTRGDRLRRENAPDWKKGAFGMDHRPRKGLQKEAGLNDIWLAPNLKPKDKTVGEIIRGSRRMDSLSTPKQDIDDLFFKSKDDAHFAKLAKRVGYSDKDIKDYLDVVNAPDED